MKKQNKKIDVIELKNYQPSEFDPQLKYFEIFGNHGLMNGRMVCGSKSIYRNKYPDHLVVFNSNIVIKSKGKIWYGDLDINIDGDKLKEISKQLKEDLYVLHEMDCRFESEEEPVDKLIENSLWSTDPKFKPKKLSGMWIFKNGKPKRIDLK